MVNLLEEKKRLINELINQGFLKTKTIIEAFKAVRREDFVPLNLKDHAYDNYPLPIGEGQTISQPLTIAAMTEALQPKSGQKILEVGSGSGYQAAILAEIVGNGKVITTERIENLVEFARKNLKKYSNITVVNCDGSKGYAKEAPYDRIIVTASAPEIPEPLIEQLNKNGRLVIPVEDKMFLIEKNEKNRVKKTFLGYYVFVPLLGEHGYRG